MRWILQPILAKTPSTYRVLLKFLGGGSTEKYVYLSVIQRGAIGFDIGANVDYFSIVYSDLAGRKGNVHAFKPDPQTFRLLKSRIVLAGCKNAIPNQVALGDTTGQATMCLPGTDSGQAALVRHHNGSWRDAEGDEYSIHIVRLDDKAVGISRIDFIKCDTKELSYFAEGRDGNSDSLSIDFVFRK